MKSSEEGFSTPLAMIVIFSLSLMVVSASMYVSTGGKLIGAAERDSAARKRIGLMVYGIEDALQAVCSGTDDSMLEPAVERELGKYGISGFTLKDVSTGINDGILKKEICERLTVSGLSPEEEEKYESRYGWFNPSFSDEGVLDGIRTEWKSDGAFPLINEFPVFNVHNVPGPLLERILAYNGIGQAGNRAQRILDCLTEETDVEGLASLLGVSAAHKVFDMLGTRTAFWEVSFEYEGYGVRAVFAAVPVADSQKNIDRYVLVEKQIVRGGERDGSGT